jgi:SAM-dependent methyltransferase
MIKLVKKRHKYALAPNKDIASEGDFIERVIGYDQAKLLLDLGLDACRRSLELARRGYLVVGFDPCEASLEEARKRAEAERLSVQFVRGDARSLVYKAQFDLALLLGERELDRHVLKKVGRALKPGGMLVLTAPNQRSGNGLQPSAAQSPTELAWLLHGLGFIGVEFFAVAAGGFRRHAPPSPEDREVGVIAVKDTCAPSLAVLPGTNCLFSKRHNGAKEV